MSTLPYTTDSSESIIQCAGEESALGEDSIHIPLKRQPRRSSMAGRVSQKGALLSRLICMSKTEISLALGSMTDMVPGTEHGLGQLAKIHALDADACGSSHADSRHRPRVPCLCTVIDWQSPGQRLGWYNHLDPGP